MTEIILPAMGEGIIEAEITRWLVKEGMQVEVDMPVVEVATDKVDSEIPSPASGIIHKILFKEGDTAKIGQVLAIIADEGEKVATDPSFMAKKTSEVFATESLQLETFTGDTGNQLYNAAAFLSPVIRKLALENGISPSEMQGITGSGSAGRITKEDLLAYLAGRSLPQKDKADALPDRSVPPEDQAKEYSEDPAGVRIPSKKDLIAETDETGSEFLSPSQIYGSDSYTVEEMTRTRKLIADHMVYSNRVSPHVSSFVETDVTEMIRWRDAVKDEFQKKYGRKLTLTSLILEAVIRALKEHPRINASVKGYNIILKHAINLGMATALPDGNLIVPVIHQADRLNLAGLAERVNDLAERARNNSLLPSEIKGGTFTVTNMGQFNNIAGTPIINQPEVAILAVGSIVKKPAVVETPKGDAIGIRHMLILTLSYDHRVVDGALGGSFLKATGDYLQSFDHDRKI